jgi:hypothetical protein
LRAPRRTADDDSGQRGTTTRPRARGCLRSARLPSEGALEGAFADGAHRCPHHRRPRVLVDLPETAVELADSEPRRSPPVAMVDGASESDALGKDIFEED